MDVAGAIPLRLVRVRDSESPGAGAVWTLLTRMRRDMEIVLRARRHGACPVVPVYTVRCATVPVLCLCLPPPRRYACAYACACACASAGLAILLPRFHPIATTCDDLAGN